MRRRSERKKSSDVSSPVPASRRTNRRRKSPSISEDDKNDLKSNEVNEKHISESNELSAGEKERDSSEERVGIRRRRSSRSTRTPIKEPQETSPLRRRRNRRETTPPENIISSIQEEENVASDEDASVKMKNVLQEKSEIGIEKEEKSEKSILTSIDAREEANDEDKLDEKPREYGEKQNIIEEKAEKSHENLKSEKLIRSSEEETGFSIKSDKDIASPSEDQVDKYDQDEVKIHNLGNAPRSRSNSSVRKLSTSKDTNEDGGTEDREVVEKDDKSGEARAMRDDLPQKDEHKLEEVNHKNDGKTNETSNTTAAADTGSNNNIAAVAPTNATTRKRRWITKKGTECKEPIMAISTDSLKTLIADVHPVPLSDVQLESSSDVEDVTSEREEGEQSPSPEPERRRVSTDKIEISVKPRPQQKESSRQNQMVLGAGTVPDPIQRQPSPARNQSSCVLYITNLVRPFTVLQLKGLLARTGKIVENGFWIDRIKSKCYVEYETEDEAIETRHALHGVRWPASNPKCLNVDFGNKSDMIKVIESTKEEAPKFGQETNKDNVLVGSGWNRDRTDDEKRGSRPVREWDVGKKENLDRDNKGIKDIERRRERSRERDSSRNRDFDRNDRIERDRNDRDRERRLRRDRENRSSSLSPARKQKKKEDPPLRLLDDLFRKTKATPCIYWLPLTPEQIAEKEALRLKRLEEQKQRLKQRELERERERERDRERERNRQNHDRDRSREREHRRPRSSDRRRSRSRERRRY